jgi:hypothetical protein
VAGALGADLAAVDDLAAADDLAADDDLAAADDLAADDDLAVADDLAAAVDAAVDGAAEAPAAAVSETVVCGLFDAVAATMMTMSAPNPMSPLSTLCRAGHDLRFGPLGPPGPIGVGGGMADCCCHGCGSHGFRCPTGPCCCGPIRCCGSIRCWCATGLYCCGCHGSPGRERWP